MTGPGAATGTGFGHGKVILLGEHAVVFGQPALAAGLRTGIRAHAVPGVGRIRVPAWNLDAAIGDGADTGADAGDGAQVARAIARLLRRLDIRGLDFSLETDLPARSGLGSSAAMSVAVARAALSARGRVDATDADVQAAAAEAEIVFHSSPSGIDGAAATLGGVGMFRKGDGWRPIALSRPLKLCVGLTGKPGNTATQVEAVALLCRHTPTALRVVETLGDAARAGAEALARGDIDSLGRLFDLAHGLLGALRVSTPELDAMVHGARAAGAIGAKLTGAGGGGAVIALAPSHSQDVIARWRADGFEGFETKVGDTATEGKR